MASSLYRTREEWLEAAVVDLRVDFKRLGFPIPKAVAVACGWPATGGLAAKRRRIGECWSAKASRGGRFEIFVSPWLDEPVRVLDVLVHELCHAAVGLDCGHRGAFKRCAVAVGLTGPKTATVAGKELRERLGTLAGVLCGYPHHSLDKMMSGRKKQGTRLIKVVCEECGYTVRTTQKWLDRGVPTCACGSEMVADALGGEEGEG